MLSAALEERLEAGGWGAETLQPLAAAFRARSDEGLLPLPELAPLLLSAGLRCAERRV